MPNPSIKSEKNLSARLRAAVVVTAVINLFIGLAFLSGPETSITLWPTPVPPLLMRFIGAIVLGNSAGVWIVAKRGTWENARALFTVALVYGIVVLVALIYHLFMKDASPIFWIYAVVDALFLVPITYIYLKYERSKL